MLDNGECHRQAATQRKQLMSGNGHAVAPGTLYPIPFGDLSKEFLICPFKALDLSVIYMGVVVKRYIRAMHN